LCFRYLLEDLDEAGILAVDQAGDVANCSLTCYEVGTDAHGRSKLKLATYNFIAPLEEGGAEVTAQVDEAGVK
jgi:2,3-bisphosphoglycerate-dependent phosphoglycerate mutase